MRLRREEGDRDFVARRPVGQNFARSYRAPVGGIIDDLGLTRSKAENLTMRELFTYPYIYYNIVGDPEVTSNMYCNFTYLYWEGCAICSIYLR